MDNVNKTLLLSLKQDLHTLNKSIENINTNSSDLNSWLFPTKNYKFVDEFIQDESIFSNVKLVLELIIDRLYVGLRLIVMTIEQNIKLDDNGAENNFLFRPTQITIGCCFENLREIVDIVINQMTEIKSSTNSLETNPEKLVLVKNRSKKHCKTQTDIASMASCDSCATAIMSMKFLLNVFDVAKDDIYQVRRVTSSIHDLTQFGCMLHTTTSIEKSLKELIEKLMKSDDENKELRDQVQILTKQLQNKKGTICLLEQENITLNDTFKKTAVQLAILKNKIAELEISKLKAEQNSESLTTNNEDLNTTLNIYREINARLKDEKTASEKICNKATEVIGKCIKEIVKLTEKYLVIEKQQDSLLNECCAMHTCLDNFVTKIKNISKMQDGMENKIKILTSDVGDNAEYLSKEIKTFQVKVQEKLLQSGLNSISVTNTNTKIQIKGNPIEDFSKQIEENNEKIKALQTENQKLEMLLLKFRRIKK